MMIQAEHGVLLICDISGYTDFVRRSAGSAQHARQITVQLLGALVQASSPPLTVVELEGDAVFFSVLGSEGELPRLAAQVKQQIPALFQAFARERVRLSKTPPCACEACSSVGSLRLKQVMHVGRVASGRVGPFEKLFGLPVIEVHRMLKSSFEGTEYLMVSEEAFSAMGTFPGVEPERHRVELEGLGCYDMHVFAAERLLEPGGSLAHVA